MPSARRPCSAIFFEIARQRSDDFVDIGAFVLGQPGNRRPRRLLQFLQQFDHDDARHLRC
jgi:hypothetical protein